MGAFKPARIQDMRLFLGKSPICCDLCAGKNARPWDSQILCVFHKYTWLYLLLTCFSRKKPNIYPVYLILTVIDPCSICHTDHVWILWLRGGLFGDGLRAFCCSSMATGQQNRSKKPLVKPKVAGIYGKKHLTNHWCPNIPRCSMVLEYLPTFTPSPWPSFVGKYSSTMVRIWDRFWPILSDDSEISPSGKLMGNCKNRIQVHIRVVNVQHMSVNVMSILSPRPSKTSKTSGCSATFGTRKISWTPIYNGFISCYNRWQ